MDFSRSNVNPGSESNPVYEPSSANKSFRPDEAIPSLNLPVDGDFQKTIVHQPGQILTEKNQDVFLVIDTLSLLFLRFRYTPGMMGQNIVQLKSKNLSTRGDTNGIN